MRHVEVCLWLSKLLLKKWKSSCHPEVSITPFTFMLNMRTPIHLYTPGLLSKTYVPTSQKKNSLGDRDKSIFAWTESGAALALHKFCFNKQSMKFSKNQHYRMTNGKQKPWQGSWAHFPFYTGRQSLVLCRGKPQCHLWYDVLFRETGKSNKS